MPPGGGFAPDPRMGQPQPAPGPGQFGGQPQPGGQFGGQPGMQPQPGHGQFGGPAAPAPGPPQPAAPAGPPAMGNKLSSAPAAGAAPMIEGLPVPWPLPTATMNEQYVNE